MVVPGSMNLEVSNNQGPTQTPNTVITRTPTVKGPPIYRNSHTYIYMYIYIYVYILYVYIYMFIYMFIYICLYIYIEFLKGSALNLPHINPGSFPGAGKKEKKRKKKLSSISRNSHMGPKYDTNLTTLNLPFINPKRALNSFRNDPQQ